MNAFSDSEGGEENTQVWWGLSLSGPDKDIIIKVITATSKHSYKCITIM